MPPTDRLHLHDARLFEFEARLLAVSSLGGAPSVVLDRTAFYAEGGGQLGDRGVLEVDGRELRVLDTQLDGELVHHLVDAADVPAGAPVIGRIDLAHRRGQTAEHTAQHMLSEALIRWAGANTAGSRLGERSTTIDLDRHDVPAEAIAEAEARVNELVQEDRPVRVHWPSPTELAGMTLRSAPKVTEGIRVVEVDGFDRTPCGGTHCASTAQVGLVRVTGLEKWGGGTRVRFVAGPHALLDYRVKDDVLGGLAREFTCGPTDVPAAVRKLQAAAKEAQQRLGAVRKELLDLVAEAALLAHPPGGAFTPIVLHRPHDDAEAVRVLAAKLSARPDVLAFVIGRSGDGSVFAARQGEAVDFDLVGWVRGPLAARFGGRGGGRAPTARGSLPAEVDLEALRAALAGAE